MKVFYFTDVHGQLDLFHAMLNWCACQDSEYHLIYGGDAADRGEYGYQIMKELLNNPRVTYLYGNHEDLFVKAADAIIGKYAMSDESYAYLHRITTEQQAKSLIQEMFAFDVLLHLNNGGYATLRDWLMDGADEDFVEQIRNLPVTYSLDNIDFCHAGGTWNTFHDAQTQHISSAIHTCIWDRDMIAIGWKTDRICVHGHTPTTYLPAAIYGRDKSLARIHPCAWHDLMGARDKKGGMKIDMDSGMFATGRSYLLDVQTLTAIGFRRLPDNTIQEDFERYQF